MSSNVIASNPAHPIFLGPQNPVGTTFSGNRFGHALVGVVTPIIIGAPGDPQAGMTILGEKIFGNGLVLFGSMTTTNFHNPNPQAANLRANILRYAANGGIVAPTAVPTLSEWALFLLILTVVFISTRVLRQH